jgi:hypothetical protein
MRYMSRLMLQNHNDALTTRADASDLSQRRCSLGLVTFLEGRREGQVSCTSNGRATNETPEPGHSFKLSARIAIQKCISVT